MGGLEDHKKKSPDYLFDLFMGWKNMEWCDVGGEDLEEDTDWFSETSGTLDWEWNN